MGKPCEPGVRSSDSRNRKQASRSPNRLRAVPCLARRKSLGNGIEAAGQCRRASGKRNRRDRTRSEAADPHSHGISPANTQKPKYNPAIPNGSRAVIVSSRMGMRLRPHTSRPCTPREHDIDVTWNCQEAASQGGGGPPADTSCVARYSFSVQDRYSWCVSASRAVGRIQRIVQPLICYRNNCHRKRIRSRRYSPS